MAKTTPGRPVAQVVPTMRTVEGGGFVVRRTFPTGRLDMVDPFLLLDHMGPADYGPGEAVGAPEHPHRGFETVTYMLEGAFEHQDSSGGGGYLGPGDVQWMTAGAGVVHSELPAEYIRREGGRVHGLPLWVNLPRADTERPLDALVISGVPLREPVARYGPFVMNTRDELVEAFDDYQSGRMGQ